MSPIHAVHRCYFCPRSRTSEVALIDHLIFWHSVPARDARRLVQRPWLSTEWPAVTLDEREGLLVQAPLPL